MDKNSIKTHSFLEKLTFLYLPILTGIYLSVVLVGTIFNLSFCSSKGCTLAGEIIKISKTSMYLLGLLSVLVATFLGFVYLKKNIRFFKELFGLLLYLMVCAESLFLGYMYLSSGGITCKICFIFYLLIIAILILFYLIKDEYTNILPKAFRTFLTIVVIIVALSLLKFDTNKNTYAPLDEGYSLIASDSCKYCKKIKARLKEDKIPFKVLDVKEYKDIILFTNGKTIPVLILKQNSKIEIYNTFTSIENHLDKSKNKGVVTIDSILKPQNPNPLFGNIKNKSDDGCSVAVECEK